VASLLGSLTPLGIVPVLAILFDRAFIAREEQILEDRFGDRSREYRKRVRRWI
jgi:protein-S-isoprenylcysteine O-methyltransferase Ste14